MVVRLSCCLPDAREFSRTGRTADILMSSLVVVFEKLFRKKETPLTGAPPVRRLKTYSAQSGYVYQYCYEGQRPIQQSGEKGTEFVFSLSSDRKSWHPCKVLLPARAVTLWETAHSRELSATERYAIAKMALFQAFDDRETPALMKGDVLVRNADVEGIVENLGL
jgi:hypothetical protein